MPFDRKYAFVWIFRFFYGYADGGGIAVGYDVRPFDERHVAFGVENFFAPDVYEGFVVFDAIEVEMVKILPVFAIVDVRGAFYVFSNAHGFGYGFHEGRFSGSEVAPEVREVAGKELRKVRQIGERDGFFDFHAENIRTLAKNVNPVFCVRKRNVVACKGSFIFFSMNEQISQEAPETGAHGKAPGKRSFMAASVLIFAVAVGLSGYLKFETWKVSDEIAAVRKELSEFETKIGALKADPMVAAADLLGRNKASLERDIERSMTQKYVAEFMRLHRDYDVDFDGFQFSGGKIGTIITARQTSAGVDPIDKIVRLVGDFRSGSGSAATSPLILSELKLVS